MTAIPPMAVGAFIERLRESFAVPANVDIGAESGLYDDLGFDSIDALRLLIFVEDLAAVLYPPEVVPPIYTVGEAFNYYRDLLEDSSLPRWD